MLISDDETTYWKIPAAGAYTWVAFDLGSEYTLTKLRLTGWYENLSPEGGCIVDFSG